MNTLVQNLRNTHRALFVLVLTTLSITATPTLLQRCQAGDGAPAGKSQAARSPKIREVVEVPEEYVGKEFTYTVRISTNHYWMRRAGAYFFLFVEDAEGTKMPGTGFSPDSTVNLIRFIVPMEEGRKLIDRLSAAQMYEARIRFAIERERNLLGSGWSYLGRISSVEIVNPPKS